MLPKEDRHEDFDEQQRRRSTLDQSVTNSAEALRIVRREAWICFMQIWTAEFILSVGGSSSCC